MDTIRRIVLRHTAGPYPGLRQIVGVIDKVGELPDILPAPSEPPANLWPDDREARALRMKSTDRYVLYQEQVTDKAAA